MEYPVRPRHARKKSSRKWSSSSSMRTWISRAALMCCFPGTSDNLCSQRLAVSQHLHEKLWSLHQKAPQPLGWAEGTRGLAIYIAQVDSARRVRFACSPSTGSWRRMEAIRASALWLGTSFSRTGMSNHLTGPVIPTTVRRLTGETSARGRVRHPCQSAVPARRCTTRRQTLPQAPLRHRASRSGASAAADREFLSRPCSPRE
jgi:hypothetical protein